ncbi:MAG: flagellin [Cyanobacteriota bacterium]
MVNTNVTSLLAQKNLKTNSGALETSLERMSTGQKINRSADNAAGLAITKILSTQLDGIYRGSNNAQDGANLLLITESSFEVITEDLQRIRELTIQAANSTNSSAERTAISLEIQQRIKDINTIAEGTKFNGINLLGLSAPTTTAGFKFTIGPDSKDVVDIAAALGNSRATALNTALVSNIDFSVFSTQLSFSNFMDAVDTALSEVLARRSRLGAMQSQLEMSVDNLEVRNINVSAAKSRLIDVNMASESAEMVKQQIMRDASVSVLVQANNIPKLVLGLLARG